jgi:hypothetical protein
MQVEPAGWQLMVTITIIVISAAHLTFLPASTDHGRKSFVDALRVGPREGERACGPNVTSE